MNFWAPLSEFENAEKSESGPPPRRTALYVNRTSQVEPPLGEVLRSSGAGFVPPRKMSPSRMGFLAILIFLEVEVDYQMKEL